MHYLTKKFFWICELQRNVCKNATVCNRSIYKHSTLAVWIWALCIFLKNNLTNKNAKLLPGRRVTHPKVVNLYQPSSAMYLKNCIAKFHCHSRQIIIIWPADYILMKELKLFSNQHTLFSAYFLNEKISTNRQGKFRYYILTFHLKKIIYHLNSFDCLWSVIKNAEIYINFWYINGFKKYLL